MMLKEHPRCVIQFHMMYVNLTYIHKDDHGSALSAQDTSDQIITEAIDPHANQHEILAYDVR